jgi:hypothetical protein
MGLLIFSNGKSFLFWPKVNDRFMISNNYLNQFKSQLEFVRKYCFQIDVLKKGKYGRDMLFNLHNSLYQS